MSLDLKDANYNDLRSYAFQNGIKINATSESGNPTKAEIIRAIKAFEKEQLKLTTSRKLKQEIKAKTISTFNKNVKDSEKSVEQRTAEWKEKFDDFVVKANELKPVLMQEVNDSQIRLEQAAKALTTVKGVVNSTKDEIKAEDILKQFQTPSVDQITDPNFWDTNEEVEEEETEEVEEEEEPEEDEETFGDLTEDDIINQF